MADKTTDSPTKKNPDTKGETATDTEMKSKMVANPFPVEEIYVDGVSGVLGRGGVLKIDCYRVLGIDKDDQSEVRRVTHRLVVPSSALPELAQVIRNIAQSVAKKSTPEADK
jgi:hypothetical protein